MTFKDLGLAQPLVEALDQQGIKRTFPIQQQAIPAVLSGHDVLGIARTGSGKTLSYLLPILSKGNLGRGPKDRDIKVLILVPTRELAVQVGEICEDLTKSLQPPVRSMAVYGGVSINPQMKGLYGVDVLVATPGRLLELHESKALSLSKVHTLVLDEADKMLNLGFREEMNRILELLPAKRQNLLFSATLSPAVKEVEQLVLKDARVVKVEEKEQGAELIHQIAYRCSEERKGPLLRYIIKKNDLNQVLVFTSATRKADNVTEKLLKNGINAMAIHSKKSQGARREALKQFKAGSLRVLVATDLLGRGIDIEFLPCVINYELPRSPKDYIHRIGRTGRAEAPGDAIALITPDEEHHFKVIQKKMKTRVPFQETQEIDLHGY